MPVRITGFRLSSASIGNTRRAMTQKISIVIQIGIAVLLTKAGPEEENPQTEPFFFLLPRQRLFSHQLDKGISFVSDFLGEEKQKLSDRLSHLEEVAHSGWNLNIPPL